MKPEFKIIGYADKDCIKPLIIIKTFNQDLFLNARDGQPRYTKLRAWENVLGKVQKVKFFIRNRTAAFSSAKEYKEWKVAESLEQGRRIRYRWDEMKNVSPKGFNKVLNLVQEGGK